MGYSKESYVNRNQPQVGQVRSYLKYDEQRRGKRIPLPMKDWAARMELTITKMGLKALELETPGQLIGFPFRAKLVPYFRMARPKNKPRSQTQTTNNNPLRQILRERLEQGVRRRGAVGIRALTGLKHSLPLEAHETANERLGDALGNLQRKYKLGDL